MGIRLKEIGELNLIKRIQTKTISSSKVSVGIGDDAAVIKVNKDKEVVVTTDTLIEEIHFQRNYYTPYQIGWKSLASNLSDIAAMGGTPKYFLVNLALPRDLNLKFWDEFYRGILDLSSIYDLILIGGDVVESPKINITITLIGEVEKDNYITRAGAKIGEVVLTSGYLGDSYAGLDILRNKINMSKKAKDHLIRSHLQPTPKVKEAIFLSQNKIPSCMIDISDGLTRELHLLKDESKVGFKIFKDLIPISPQLILYCNKMKKDPFEIALSGGEDYQLLFTCSQEKLKLLKKGEFNFHILGEVISEKEILLIEEEKAEVIKDIGYEHFRDNY